jgi:hypothetical protein
LYARNDRILPAVEVWERCRAADGDFLPGLAAVDLATALWSRGPAAPLDECVRRLGAPLARAWLEIWHRERLDPALLPGVLERLARACPELSPQALQKLAQDAKAHAVTSRS